MSPMVTPNRHGRPHLDLERVQGGLLRLARRLAPESAGRRLRERHQALPGSGHVSPSRGRPRDPAGGVLLPAGSQRLRQDLVPAHDRRLRAPDRRSGSPRRAPTCAGVPPYRRDVNTVFQNYALFPHMTVEQNVAYPLRMAKIGQGRDREPGRRGPRYGGDDRVREAAAAPAIGRAAPAGGARSGAGRAARRCCSSTSRWVPWTSSFASRCSWCSSTCSARSGSPSST